MHLDSANIAVCMLLLLLIGSPRHCRSFQVKTPIKISRSFVRQVFVFSSTTSATGIASTPTRTTTTALPMMSDSPKEDKVFAPSQFIVDENTGKKYRLAAAAAVWNSENHLLVGERLHIANAWQAPQGGVDAAWEENNHQEETCLQAASRELYEEMGLQVGKHVVPLSEITTEKQDLSLGVRYETQGTSNWLTKAGFAGQELHWVHFRCIDGRGDADPNLMCDLSGLNGESPEFQQVAWRPLPAVVEEMWPAKRGPYEALQLQQVSMEQEWQTQCQACAQHLAGRWSRDNTQCRGVVEGLVARGTMTLEQAQEAASKPYIQEWKFNDNNKSNDWTVITYNDDGVTPRRTLVYPWGEWEETYQGESMLFGAFDSSVVPTLKRRTFYAPEPVDDESNTTVAVAHVTISETPKGDTEESRRYRQGDTFILKRTFWPKDNPENGVVSKEVFVKQKPYFEI